MEMTRLDRWRDEDGSSSGRGTAARRPRATFRDQYVAAADFFFGARRAEERSQRRATPAANQGLQDFTPAVDGAYTRGARVDDEPAVIDTQPLLEGAAAGPTAGPGPAASAPPEVSAPATRPSGLLPYVPRLKGHSRPETARKGLKDCAWEKTEKTERLCVEKGKKE